MTEVVLTTGAVRCPSSSQMVTTNIPTPSFLQPGTLREWRNGIIIPLPKKGDLSECGNWQGMTLLSVPRKSFASVVLDRIKRLWIMPYDRNRPVLDQEDHAMIRYSHCDESWKLSLQAVTLLFSTLLTFAKPLTVYTGQLFGKSSGCTAFQRK